jgi:hypothetical protein
MKRKHFLSPLSSELFVMLLLVFSSLFLHGCNSNREPKPEAEDWLNLTIKFNDNSTAVIRDISLRTIENFIADSLEKMNAGDYKDFHPQFVRTSDPREPLVTTLSVGFRDQYGKPKIPSGPEIMAAPAPCRCETECRICRLAKVLITNPMDSVPAFPVSDYIISTETTHEHPKDSTKK